MKIRYNFFFLLMLLKCMHGTTSALLTPWTQVSGPSSSGKLVLFKKRLQSEMLHLQPEAWHLCCSDCSTPAWAFLWYYFPVFCSRALLLEIVLQCVCSVFFQLALFEISPPQLLIQQLARCPAVLHFYSGSTQWSGPVASVTSLLLAWLYSRTLRCKPKSV